MQLKTTYLREAKERAIRNSYFRENIYNIYIYIYILTEITLFMSF